MKILIIKPSSLGDVVQALPVLRLLKLHWPGSEIHWWIEKSLSPLLADDPDLSGLILFDRKRWKTPRGWPEAWNAVRSVRAHRFDFVIDLQSLFRSGLAAWLACGQYTIGLDDRRELAPIFFDTAVLRPSPETHAVDWYLEVLRALKVPVHSHFTWLPSNAATKKQTRAKYGLDEGLWIGLQPGARWTTKRWPHFAEALCMLSKELPEARFCILGGVEDREIANAICDVAAPPVLNLAGQTSLPEMVECVRAFRLFITNDTGPMHVAAAVGTPVVALFGPTDPRRTGPYGQLDHALIAPTKCLESLSPDVVCERALWLLTGSIDQSALRV